MLASIWRNVFFLNPHTLLIETKYGAFHMENGLVVPQKAKHRIIT
jgi:hypothetical protein